MEPKYKVGDRVRVIQRTEDVNRYRCGFVDNMAAKAGKIYTIASSQYIGADKNKLPDDGYIYHLKEISFTWTSSMLEPVSEEPKVLNFTPKKKHYQLRFTV